MVSYPKESHLLGKAEILRLGELKALGFWFCQKLRAFIFKEMMSLE